MRPWSRQALIVPAHVGAFAKTPSSDGRAMPPARALSTAAAADACLSLGLPLRMAPPGLVPARAGAAVAGPARPVRHVGSVDIFLEAIEAAHPGDVLVADNGGRDDEGCLGDLIAAEAHHAGLAGVVIWGRHRDTREIRLLGFPVFSYGAAPAGPRRLDTRPPEVLQTARLGPTQVARDDWVFADDDGAVVVAERDVADVLKEGARIATRERAQAEAMRRGATLRSQMRFREYLERRTREPGLTLRQHLKDAGAAVEV